MTPKGGIRCRSGIKQETQLSLTGHAQHHTTVLPLIDAESQNDTRHTHSYNGILIRTYTRPTQQCDLE